jgi:hypothetical protein
MLALMIMPDDFALLLHNDKTLRIVNLELKGNIHVHPR